MTVNTVSNFLATYGEGSLHELRELLEKGTPYQAIAERFGVTHVAVVKWRQKFFRDRVLFNHETQTYLAERNTRNLEQELSERRRIKEHSLVLLRGGARA